jgi:hypothetical protein
MTKESFYERIENILESKSLTYEDLFFMITSIVDGLEAVGSLDLVRPEKEIVREDDKEDEVKVYQNNIAGIPLEVVYGALFDEN